MVTITRVGFRKYSFSSNIPRELAICKKALSLWIDGCQYSQAFKDKKWDGYKKFFTPSQEFEIGLLDELVNDLNLKKISFKILEEDFRGEIVDGFVLKDSLRLHQQEAVIEFFNKNIGIIKIPTRGGKTFVSGEIIRQILINNPKSDFLFYVDTTDLFNQTVEELAKFLNVQEKSIGTIDSFGVNIKQVTVAMIQTVTSIYSRKKPEMKILEKYFKNLNCLIVDEIQEYMSDNRMRLMKKCKNVNFLLGLSATPYKQGNLAGNIQIKEFFGGIVYEVPIERLQEEGWLSTDKVILISHQHTRKVRVSEEDKNSKYQQFLKKLIHESKDRNMILLQLIQMCKKNKWKTLVIFNSKQHGYLISELSECIFICGDDKTDKRHEEKEKFLRGRGKVLLASNIYKKGITLPEVEILIIADGGLEGSSIMQKKGRVLGAVENKSRAVTIDIMDIEENYFSEHSLNRLDIYSESVGADRVEVYDETDLIDVEQSIKEWFDE